MDRSVAVCLSGQMRTYRKCYGYLKENIIEPLNPDIFIDTWRERGGTTKASSVSKSSELVTEETLQRLYSPEAVRIEEFEERYFTKKDHVTVPQRLREHTTHWKGNIPMFYKMHGCNEMKKRKERDSENKYDLAIRLRPDLIVGDEIPQKVLENPDTLWFADCQVDTQTQVSDKFAVSSSDNMDYYSSVWELLMEYWSKPLGSGEWKDVRVGERLMRHHFDKSDITYRPFSGNCELLRSRGVAIEESTPTVAEQLQRVLDFLSQRLSE